MVIIVDPPLSNIFVDVGGLLLLCHTVVVNNNLGVAAICTKNIFRIPCTIQ
jgi:hypothetical protein